MTSDMSAINPDCRDGNKHRACAGDAWDDTTDSPTTCQCDCHGGTSMSYTIRPAAGDPDRKIIVCDVCKRPSEPSRFPELLDAWKRGHVCTPATQPLDRSTVVAR